LKQGLHFSAEFWRRRVPLEIIEAVGGREIRDLTEQIL
jgi:hypothetical protein